MAEVTAVAVGTVVAGEDHAADLRLVTGVADHWAELLDAVSELAMVSVGTGSSLLPFVAELRLEHSLVVHLQLQCILLLGPSTNIHLRSSDGTGGSGSSGRDPIRSTSSSSTTGSASCRSSVHIHSVLQIPTRPHGDALGKSNPLHVQPFNAITFDDALRALTVAVGISHRPGGAIGGGAAAAGVLPNRKPPDVIEEGQLGGEIGRSEALVKRGLDEEAETLVEVSVGEPQVGVLTAEGLSLLGGLVEVSEAEVVAVEEVLMLEDEASLRRVREVQVLAGDQRASIGVTVVLIARPRRHRNGAPVQRPRRKNGGVER